MSTSGVKRLSMNTSLKNARIFDDDSWDAETAGFITKQEPVNSISLMGGEEGYFKEVRVKKEHSDEIEFDSDTGVQNQRFDSSYPKISDLKKEIKKEPLDDASKIIKKEHVNNEPFLNFKIKKDAEDILMESDQYQSYDFRLTTEIKSEAKPNINLETPVKKELKSELFTDESNPSPFNKELFQHFNFKQDSPQSNESSHQSTRPESRKSARRTVFTRESPYKRYFTEESSNSNTSTRSSHNLSVKERLGPKITDDTSEGEAEEDSNRISVKKRLGPTVQSDYLPRKKYKSQEMESSPEVLARRQKQIDFGKNTIGYDNYIQTVPKKQRTQDDPKTPNKYMKYSRRGWDGLIKQWRLKLHKYDPVDT